MRRHIIIIRKLDFPFPERHPEPAEGPVEGNGKFSTFLCAAEYLLAELKQGGQQFTASGEAMRFVAGFWQYLDGVGRRAQFQEALNMLQANVAEQYALSEAWLEGFADSQDLGLGRYREEAAVVVTCAEPAEA